MPASTTRAPAPRSATIMRSRLSWDAATRMPRRPSLAPNSRITIAGLRASTLSIRARPPLVVSPLTPSFTTR